MRALDTGLSEYSFANLYLFRRAHDYRFVDGDLPYVYGSTNEGRRHVMPLTSVEPDMVGQLQPGNILTSRVLTGCYPWLSSRYAAASGVARFNFEQDLGETGFRRAKRASAPIGQLHKYRIG